MTSDLSACSSDARLHDLCGEYLASFWERWEKMGLEREPLADRIEVVVDEMKKTLNGMLREEDGYIAKVVNHIEKHGIEMAKLSKVNSLPRE